MGGGVGRAEHRGCRISRSPSLCVYLEVLREFRIDHHQMPYVPRDDVVQAVECDLKGEEAKVGGGAAGSHSVQERVSGSV